MSQVTRTDEDPMQKVRAAIRSVPDFPSAGILFRDITPVLLNPELFASSVEGLSAPFDADPPSHVVAIESRGFLFAAPMALRWEAGLVPVRKAGKLPARTEREEYSLEYGSAVLEIHGDALAPGDRVVVVDDLLATGGTAAASARLVERLGARVIGFTFLVELTGLGGRELIGSRGDVLVYSAIGFG